jgi:Glucodextranase, domain B/PASTA domain
MTNVMSCAASLGSQMRAPLLALIAVAVVVAGCGGDSRQRPAKPPAPVELHVSTPSDMDSTRGSIVTVSGSVTPADAAVRVLGRSAEVVAGSFTARVPLQPGANVIDLMASAHGRDPAMTALRVTRDMPIQVPDLTHLTPDDARARVERLGLKLRTESGGGLLEPILPGTPGVCDQRPDPGTRVERGSEVLVLVAKRC